MPRAAVVLAAALATAAAIACGASRLPAPSYTEQPTAALREVPYPPPPARVEVIPARPNGGAVWLDGEWTWQTRRWAWKPGRWLVAPPDAKFAPWTTVRDRSGTLYLASGTWRSDAGVEVQEPEPLAIGRPTPAAIVSPEGDDIPLGPLAPLDAGVSEGNTARDAAAAQAMEALDASRTTGDGSTMEPHAEPEPSP